MTEPYRLPQCPACNRSRGHAPSCPLDPKPSADLRALLAAYVELRRNCIGIEELIERAPTDGDEAFTADDLKRLDKAVTVMKVGFKMAKRVLRAHGVVGTNSWRSTPAREEALRLAGAAGLDPDPDVVGGVKEGGNGKA